LDIHKVKNGMRSYVRHGQYAVAALLAAKSALRSGCVAACCGAAGYPRVLRLSRGDLHPVGYSENGRTMPPGKSDCVAAKVTAPRP
jgi:hypothetical protein